MKSLKCMEVLQRDKKVLAPCQHVSYFPLVVEKGEQDFIRDIDGNRYIDFFSSASALNIGNNHPIIENAIMEQAKECIQYSPAYIYNVPMVTYAEKLTSVYPGNIEAKIWFGNSGSDANDAAIKFCRAYTKRSKIITFINAYHGSTFGSSSLSACSPKMHNNMGPFLSDIYHFHFWGELDIEKKPVDYLAELKEAFNTYLNPFEVAAVIIEPLQGDGGMNMALPEFITQLYDLCHKYGILFISDEVQQAFFRNKFWFSIENFHIIPDGIVLGKTIGGGIPLSAFMARKEIMDTLPPIAHTFTLGGGPLACKAGIAQFDYMCSEHFQKILHRNENCLASEISMITQKSHSIIGNVSGSGMSYGIHIIDKETKRPNNIDTFKIVFRCYEYGLLLLSVFGNVLRIQPPLNIKKENLKRGFEIIDKAILDVEKGLVPDEVLKHNHGW